MTTTERQIKSRLRESLSMLLETTRRELKSFTKPPNNEYERILVEISKQTGCTKLLQDTQQNIEAQLRRMKDGPEKGRLR